MASTAAERGRRWPWHRRLVARYAGTLAAVALGSTLLVAVPLYVLAAQLLEQALDERLEGTAELAALEVPAGAAGTLGREATGPAAAALRERLATLREEADLDALYLVAPDGTVELLVGMETLRLTNPDRAALAGAAGEDASNTPIQIDDGGARFLTAYAPTSDPALLLGVRASAPYLERLDALRSLLGPGAVAWGAVVALLGALFGARLTRPIQRLLDATDRLAAGAEPEPPEPGGSAELDSLQEAFAEMAASVRQRERRLRALAGAVAHEVRNPGNALRLHLGLLRRDLGPDAGPRVRDRVAVLEGELEALEATVDGFLVFAQDRTARREPVDLRALLERAADGAPVDAPAVVVLADPLLIGRAVGNLVRNAREAGGEPVAVRAVVDGRILHIEVADAGPGFPPALAPRAFEPFVSGRVGGSGLGLAIVAAVAVSHGGEAVLVHSERGRTVVALRMPLDRA
jgi:signal transduction histidine kinase